MRQQIVTSAVAGALVLGITSVAAAHPGHAGDHFGDGFRHPLLGLDHLLAMVAVGLLAARAGGKALWALPAAFLAAMVCGGLLATSGLFAFLNINASGFVEYGIMSSVLVLGVMIAATRVAPLKVGVALVAIFALFHGYAHAAEMAAGTSLTTYAAGFVLATALLHTAGIAAGLALARAANTKPLRISGAAIGALGLLMLFGMI